jgi:hypothetical protein
VTSFAHEQQRKFSEAEYISATGLLERRTRLWRLALVFAVAIACLFRRYTFALGLVLVVIGLIALLLPGLLPAGAASTYRENPLLRQELTYRVTDRELSVLGTDLRCQCGWENLKVWRQRDGWLILSANGMPQIFLSVQLLEEAGVYEDVLTLARQNAREFNK